MATITRRNVYSTVPGFDQPDSVAGPTENVTLPFSGTGGSNPYLAQEASSDYYIPSAITNYSENQRLYSQDAGAFGMLASFYGPNMRLASSMSLRDIYGGDGFANFGFGGGNAGVSVLIDRDLSNKQAETGTVAWLRKVQQDLTPTNMGAYNYALEILANRNPQYGKVWAAEQNEARVNASIASSDWNTWSGSIKAAPLQSNEYRMPNGTLMSGSKFLNNDYRNSFTQDLTRQAVRNSVITTTSVGQPSWNTPNQNLFGGYGVKTYGDYDRLAPTSISQGSGTFSSARYTLKPVSKTFLKNFGMW